MLHWTFYIYAICHRPEQGSKAAGAVAAARLAASNDACRSSLVTSSAATSSAAPMQWRSESAVNASHTSDPYSHAPATLAAAVTMQRQPSDADVAADLADAVTALLPETGSAQRGRVDRDPHGAPHGISATTAPQPHEVPRAQLSLGRGASMARSKIGEEGASSRGQEGLRPGCHAASVSGQVVLSGGARQATPSDDPTSSSALATARCAPISPSRPYEAQ